MKKFIVTQIYVWHHIFLVKYSDMSSSKNLLFEYHENIKIKTALSKGQKLCAVVMLVPITIIVLQNKIKSSRLPNICDIKMETSGILVSLRNFKLNKEEM